MSGTSARRRRDAAEGARLLRLAWPGDCEIGEAAARLEAGWLTGRRHRVKQEATAIAHLIRAVGHLDLAGERDAALAILAQLRERVLEASTRTS